MSNYIRPNDSVTMSLSDKDLLALISGALESNYLNTNGYREEVTVDVSSISFKGDGCWSINYVVNVEDEENPA